MRNIHFTNNTSANADTDRVWKVTSISDTLQKTFKAGYNIPGVLAFDEAMISSRSRYNPTRRYLKEKPHK
ncbi:hypothetical protein PR002_g5166 [Phytophthora rubi]|nr:hypothetical protein PR002_g5166 [Phytophthora rubi]